MFVPGGPDERTVTLQVRDDGTLESNETFRLRFELGPAAIASGGRIGARNQSRVTIINDDSEFNHHTGS